MIDRKRIGRLVLATLMALGAATSSLRAGEIAGVLELFTSQGCSSCPAADKLLSELAKDPDVIALSFPVDYWDYNGWKDTLAAPAHTGRQKAYSAARGDGHVFTPQVIVNGVTHAIGSDRVEIAKASQEARRKGGAVNVPLTVMETPQGGFTVTLGAATNDSAQKSATLYLLRVAKQRAVAVGRGENAGRTLVYTNVVRAMTRLADWSGQAMTLDVPASQTKGADSDAFVVLLQSGSTAKPGAILAAAKGPGR